MDVLKINYRNPAAGAFAAIPAPNEIPTEAKNFGLVQICRLSREGHPVENPSGPLNWEKSGADIIKAETLNNTGWFIDFLKKGKQDNFLYYMTSFTSDEQEAYLEVLRGEGDDTYGGSGRLYTANNLRGTEISVDTFKRDFAPYFVATGTKPNQYPVLLDVPQQNSGCILDFEVHMVYCTGYSDTPTYTIVPSGFTWTYNSDSPTSTFGELKNNISDVFAHCVTSAIQFQKPTRESKCLLV